MAEANISVSQDQFCCSICLEVLKDPVTTPCGHSFCMMCINDCWDQEDNKGTFSCPQCREIFTPRRPAVSKNIIMAEVVEKPKLSDSVPCSAGSGDVECDFCTESKNKAVKSCLVCLVSFCEIHLQPHYQSSAFKKHKLVEASRRLQDQICSQHDKLLEVYCRTDHKCICMLCIMDDHKGHDTTSTAAERTEKQMKLKEIQGNSQQKIQKREEEIQKLKKAVQSNKRSAQATVENIENLLTDLISSIQRRWSDVTKLIRYQSDCAVSQAEELIERWRKEIEELKKQNDDLEQLSHHEDSIHFLQNVQSHLVSAGPVDSPAITINPLLTYKSATKSMSQLKEKLEEVCHHDKKQISWKVREIGIISQPQTKEEFRQYFCRFSLDPNTVNKFLCLSEENKVATYSGTSQSYPDHPDRFDYYLQVLSSESVCERESVCVSGRCYWEVEWSGNDGVFIAAAYKSISRKGSGRERLFGYNNLSWSLFCSPSEFSFLHNNKGKQINIKLSSCRIGVYVDYRAGILSFYNVSNTMKLLHTVQTKFTRTLYPGFVVCKGSTVKLSS